MSTLASFSLLGQLPAALFATLVVAGMVGTYLLLRRLRRRASGTGMRRTEQPSTPAKTSASVVARVVAISESRIGRGLERETANGLLRRPGLGYHPQRLERRIAVLR